MRRGSDIRYYPSPRQRQIYLRRRLVACLVVAVVLGIVIAVFVGRSGASDDEPISGEGAAATRVELRARGKVFETIGRSGDGPDRAQRRTLRELGQL